MSEPIAATIYANQLINQKEGYPVWEPDPQDEPTVEIADVGYIKNGAFVRLFNASKEPGDTVSNRFGVPDSYGPLEIGEIQKRNALPANVPIQSESVMQCGAQATLSAGTFIQAGGGFSFECSRQQGAVLILGDDADRRDALRLPPFLRYMNKHHASWLTFANEVRQRGIALNELILVTGCDLTSAWACAAFSGKSNQAAVSFQVGPVGIAQSSISIWGTWKNCSSVAARSGPRRRSFSTVPHINPPRVQPPHDFDDVAPREERVDLLLPPPRNQCVFLRGFRICDKPTMLARLLIRKKKKPAYDGFYYISREKKDEEDPDFSGPFGGNKLGSGAGGTNPWPSTQSPNTGGARSSGSDSSSNGQSEDHGSPSDDSLSEEYLGDLDPILDKEPTAFDFLLEYILDSSSAKVAVVHDDDLVTLLQGSPHITDFERWIQTLAPNVIIDQNQVGMFEPTYRLLVSESQALKNSSPLATRPDKAIFRPDEETDLTSSSSKQQHVRPSSDSRFGLTSPGLPTTAYSGSSTTTPPSERDHSPDHIYATDPRPLPPMAGLSGGELASRSHEFPRKCSRSDPELSRPRRYRCEECGVRFDGPNALDIHMRVHDGEKPFMCGVPGCIQRFTLKTDMLRHERTHTARAASGYKMVEETEEGEADEPPSSYVFNQPQDHDSQEAQLVGSPIDQHLSPLWDRQPLLGGSQLPTMGPSTENPSFQPDFTFSNGVGTVWQTWDNSCQSGAGSSDLSRRYVCKGCGERFAIPSALLAHIKKYSPKPPPSPPNEHWLRRFRVTKEEVEDSTKDEAEDATRS